MALEAIGLHPDFHGLPGGADADQAVFRFGLAADGIKAGPVGAPVGIEDVQLRAPSHRPLQKLPIHHDSFKTCFDPLLIDQRQDLFRLGIEVGTGNLEAAPFPIGAVPLILQVFRKVQAQGRTA